MRSRALTDGQAGRSPLMEGARQSGRQPRPVFGMERLTVVVLALAAFTQVLASRGDFDYWWHLAAGRYMSEHRALPIPDPFSFTASGRTWVTHEWLSELLMFQLYDAFGVVGPAVLFGLCMAGTVLMMLATLRRIGTRFLPVVLWATLMMLAMWPWAYARPQVVAFSLMAAQIWLIERWLAQRDRSIWVLPALYVLWANLHGSFAVGLAVPLLVLLGETAALRLGWWTAARLRAGDLRRLALAVLASVGALVFNPNGPALLVYPFTKFNNSLLKYLGEWNASDIGNPALWPFTLLLAGAVVLIAVRRPRLPLADLLLGGAFVTGGLWSMRFVPFAALCLTVVVGRMLTLPNGSGMRAPRFIEQWAAWRERRAILHTRPSVPQQLMNLGVLGLAVATVLSTVRPYRPDADARLPVTAADALGADGLRGPLFHDYNWGGYLIWRFWPRVPVFIDGRGDDLYMQGHELRKYFDVAMLEADTDDVLDEYGIRTVLFQKNTPLTRYLLAGGRWQATYDDGQVVRLERRP